ncbi:MAG: tetratricopeptide repeat protein [Acidobacteria bacterium]|nr:tetratricopeptide repeat protein [Acidobacteriota bacterium]
MSNARTLAVVFAALVLLVGCQSQTTYIQRRAQQGDPGAQYALGDMYSTGEGVPRDVRKAVKWYRKAAEQGHASAQFALVLYSSEVPEWEEWLRLAAKQGHIQAQLYLASRYREGDWVKAVKWYREAAEKGHAEAQTLLGGAYEIGR